MTRLVLAAVMVFGALVGYAEARSAKDAPAAGARRAAKDVVMYVMPGCGYCEAARRHLRERGVAWIERDVTASAEASAEFESKGGVGTPLILVDGEKVEGYNAQRLDRLLAQ